MIIFADVSEVERQIVAGSDLADVPSTEAELMLGWLRPTIIAGSDPVAVHAPLKPNAAVSILRPLDADTAVMAVREDLRIVRFIPAKTLRCECTGEQSADERSLEGTPVGSQPTTDIDLAVFMPSGSEPSKGRISQVVSDGANAVLDGLNFRIRKSVLRGWLRSCGRAAHH